jgi:hypothetical protein
MSNATVQWEDHWQTWSVNRDYYGMHTIDDVTGKCVTPTHDREWSVEWATKPEADRIARWTDAIDQLLRDVNVNHVRLAIRVEGDTVFVRNYDYGQEIGQFNTSVVAS